jgi:hypothetical protein
VRLNGVDLKIVLISGRNLRKVAPLLRPGRPDEFVKKIAQNVAQPFFLSK